jgi:hypothetical protein
MKIDAHIQIDAEREHKNGGDIHFNFKTQDRPDVEKLQKSCPPDRQVHFVGRWIDPLNFVLEKVEDRPLAVAALENPSAGKPAAAGDGSVTPDVLRAQLLMKTIADLRTLAAEKEIKVPANATKPSIVDLLVDAAARVEVVG